MKVVVYIREGCPYCRKILDYLQDHPHEYVEIYVADKDFKTSTFKNKYGSHATFPRGYVVKGEKIKLLGGSSEILEYLKNHK